MSCGPGRLPRSIDARKTSSRSDRSVSDASTGCSVGRIERDQVAAVVAAVARGAGRRGDRVGGQAVQAGGIGDVHGGRVRAGQQPRAELGGQCGQFRVQRTQPLLLGRAETGPGTHGVAVMAFEQPQRLRVESQLVAALVQRVEPGEQAGVEPDRVAVRGQLRRDLGLDLLDPRRRVRADPAEEHPGDPVQRPPGPLERDDRVANVGPPEATISSTSISCSAMPASNAGRKWSSEIAVKSGTSNGSVLGARNGLASVIPST